jgi:hypothetical protein
MTILQIEPHERGTSNMIVRALEELREVEQLTASIVANLKAIDLDGRSLADL